jgi:energy-coupling factor transporter ATP-binding protein EcfA2
MRLLRVQVPNFRALKDVDISFEPDFVPNIFPIGSQNGGGKSTLFQLIFVLLHCASNQDRHDYIRNLLTSFEGDNFSNAYTLAKISLEYNHQLFDIDFFCRSTIHPDTRDILHDEGCFVVLEYAEDENSEPFYLVCQVFEKNNRQNQYLHHERIRQLLTEFSEKIFLAMPETPIFLFLTRQINRHLLQVEFNSHAVERIREAQKNLPGLFTYNFVAVNSLIEIFKTARDLDFQKAIETGGEYGKSYEVLLSDFNQFLGGVKQVNVISADLDEITFYKMENGKRITLYPEDLSRGEMKRLSLYVWLKQQQIQDSVVLIDEVETALHPDWQYQIVSDLTTWAASNQYLLATHSYELCEALTPAHVKQIPPNLIPKTPVSL